MSVTAWFAGLRQMTVFHLRMPDYRNGWRFRVGVISSAVKRIGDFRMRFDGGKESAVSDAIRRRIGDDLDCWALSIGGKFFGGGCMDQTFRKWITLSIVAGAAYFLPASLAYGEVKESKNLVRDEVTEFTDLMDLMYLMELNETVDPRGIDLAGLGGERVYHVGQTCGSTSDCSPGENCKNGVCQLANGPGICLNNVDCAPGERCVDGHCRN